MSAEKEIINYWYNKKGYFTIHNIKTYKNKDAGILALKLDKNEPEILHIQVNCSITGTIDTKNIGSSAEKISEDKFYDDSVAEALKEPVRVLNSTDSKIKNVLVLNSLPRSKKDEIIKEFRNMDVEVIEFETVIFDVLQNLDTQYYKNDIIRTLQLTKFLLLSNPEKAAKLLVNGVFNSSSRKEFLSSMLDKDEIIKELITEDKDFIGLEETRKNYYLK